MKDNEKGLREGHPKKASFGSTKSLLGQMEGWLNMQWPMFYANYINTDDCFWLTSVLLWVVENVIEADFPGCWLSKGSCRSGFRTSPSNITSLACLVLSPVPGTWHITSCRVWSRVPGCDHHGLTRATAGGGVSHHTSHPHHHRLTWYRHCFYTAHNLDFSSLS